MCWELPTQSYHFHLFYEHWLLLISGHMAVGQICLSIDSTRKDYPLLHRQERPHTCCTISEELANSVFELRCPHQTDTLRRCERNSSAFFSASCGTRASRSSMCFIAEAAKPGLASASLRIVRLLIVTICRCQLHFPSLPPVRQLRHSRPELLFSIEMHRRCSALGNASEGLPIFFREIFSGDSSFGDQFCLPQSPVKVIIREI